MSYSVAAKRNLLATTPDDPFLILLEITHPDLPVPIRVVNNTVDIVSNGNDFLAIPFDITLPDSKDQQVPKARLSVDNIGRELTQWLEFSRGGKGAKCRIMQVLASDPDTIELDITMDLTGLSVNNSTVDGELGFQDTLNQSAVAVRYEPKTAPGLW